MRENKVSIIVPIYNVDKYLQACLESVINQTYINLQIILVNDGSNDLSGEICNKYERLDKRIFVLHKKNGGLSDARNVGTSHATGDFLFYLDSDDYLELDAIEKLIDCQNKTNADIVIGNYFYTYLNHETVANSIPPYEIIQGNEEAIRLLVEGKILNFAWGKLFRTETVKKYQFPKGKLFEDHFWMHFILHESKIIAFISDAIVHYRQRNDSISYTFNFNRLDILDGWENRISFLENYYPELVDRCLQQYAINYINIAWSVLIYMDFKNKAKAFQKLRKYNENWHLEKHANGKNKVILKKLQIGNFSYIVVALWYKIRRF